MHYVKDFLPFHFFCSSEFRLISLYPLALGAAESRDGMITNQRSRGGAAMFVYLEFSFLCHLLDSNVYIIYFKW